MREDPPRVEVRSSRIGNVVLGLAAVGGVAVIVSMVILWDDDSLFFARDTRQPGIIKGFERLIGWEAFIALLAIAAVFFLFAAAVRFWKASDATAEVTATPTGLEFHPAVRRPASYADVVEWSCDGTRLSIRFHEAYWSLQGIFPRRCVRVYGSRQKLEPLADYLRKQPGMKDKVRTA
jgi:hypothetical protein